MIELYDYQKGKVKTPNTALFWKMGRGKTYGGLDRAEQYGSQKILIVCQKSKIEDWIEAVRDFYGEEEPIYNLRNKTAQNAFLEVNNMVTGVINYDLLHRRPELLHLVHFTLILDESSLISNPSAKRTRFIRRLKPEHVVLLSGTPDKGKYEELVTQCQLLGWKIKKQEFWDKYVRYSYNTQVAPIPIPIIYGYKNIDNLMYNLKKYGAEFLDEDGSLPKQLEEVVNVPVSKEYRKFDANEILEIDGETLLGDSSLSKLLRLRQLCGQYSEAKLEKFKDLIDSCESRIIVFYNFTEELNKLLKCVGDRPVSIINGQTKDKTAYDEASDSITFVQYQAGAMGLNLQKANYEIMFTLPLSSELFEQAKKRIHRIGQEKDCFYYYLICKNSVEEKIYKTLLQRRDYSAKLFEREVQDGN